MFSLMVFNTTILMSIANFFSKLFKIEKKDISHKEIEINSIKC